MKHLFSFLQTLDTKMNLLLFFGVLLNLLLITKAVNLVDGVTRLKNKVNSAINELTRYSNTLESNLKFKLNNIKFNQMTSVNTAVDSAMKDTRKAISTANAQGKNADHCLEPMRLRLRDISLSAFDSFEKCVSDQVNELKPVEQNIQTHLLNGNLLLSKLDLVVINCASGTPMQVQICIAQNMPEAHNSVNNYESTVSQLKNTGDSISNSGVIGATRCFLASMSTLYNNVSSARISSDTCIKSS